MRWCSVSRAGSGISSSRSSPCATSMHLVLGPGARLPAVEAASRQGRVSGLLRCGAFVSPKGLQARMAAPRAPPCLGTGVLEPEKQRTHHPTFQHVGAHRGPSAVQTLWCTSFGIHPVVQRENRCGVSGGLLEVNLVSFCPATVSEPAA